MTEEESMQTQDKDNQYDIKDDLDQVFRRESNKALALISDNPDGTAEILLIRGDSGDAECYWYHMSNAVMSPLLKKTICHSLHLTEDELHTDDGIYSYMATATGMAACFQSNIPGLKLMQAFFAPFEHALYEFIATTRGWSRAQMTFIKRNRNLAYRYRKDTEAINKAHKPINPTGDYDDYNADTTFEDLVDQSASLV